MINSIIQWYKKLKSVPLYIGGMVPAVPNQPDTGTTVALFSEDRSEKLELGKCNENGESYGRIPKTFYWEEIILSCETCLTRLEYRDIRATI